MKTQTLRRAEMMDRIYAVINEAELPAFAVADALRTILATAEQAAQDQLQHDIQRQAAEEQAAEEQQEQGEQETTGEE